MKFLYSVVILSFVVTCCDASLVGWLLGRVDSPFSITNSEDEFDRLVTAKPAEEPVVGDAVSANVPFELSVADEKFIADAQKYTDLNLSELDICQHRLILRLERECGDLTEEDLSKLGVNLLNCQSALEGRTLYPCTSTMSLKECTKNMDSDTWNAYHILSNRARSVCYGARQQQFRALTQMTVNKLMASSNQQLGFIRELKAEQEMLGTLASGTLESLTKGQEKLLEQQDFLKAIQQHSSQQISLTMRELSRERAAAHASQLQIAALTDTLKETLNQAAQLATEQENERKKAQLNLLESLSNIEGRVGDAWSQLEDSVMQLLARQEHAAHMQTETVETLQRLNRTFQFLLSVSETSRDQLYWIQGLVANTEKRLGKLSTWVLHACYFLMGMLLLSFAQAPSYTRWIFLLLIPINLAMDLRQGVSMELPELIGFMFILSIGFRLFIYIKNRCRSSLEKQKEIMYRSSAPETKVRSSTPDANILHERQVDKSVEELLNGCTLIADESYLDSHNVTPPPTSWDTLIEQSQNRQHHSVRSILQESRLEDSSIIGIHRRSPRIASSLSFRDISPTRSVASNASYINYSKSGTPRRSGTPRGPRCSGKCVDGSSCRNPPMKDSVFCRQHK